MSHALDEQSTRLYRIRKTVMEMLRDRDYVVAEFELSFSKEQFREKYGDEPKREDLVIQKPKRSNNAEHVRFLALFSRRILLLENSLLEKWFLEFIFCCCRPGCRCCGWASNVQCILSCFQIFVFFPEEAKVGVKTIKTYVDRMKTENVHRAILVVQQNLTPFARQCVSEMSSKYHLEVFQVRPTQRFP